MSSCSIKWCGKNSRNSNYSKDGVTFHRYPDIPEFKEKWIEATRRENWFPTKYSIICSKHFTSDCFDPVKKKRRLFSSAVPTLFLPILGNEGETSNHSESTTSIIEKAFQLAQSNNEPENNATQQQRAPTATTAEITLCRKVDDLSLKLRNSQLANKRLQDKNRILKNKLSCVTGFFEKLKNKGTLTQENIDVERLQGSNRQLRKKVVLLRRLLYEQKKRGFSAKRNVVWCPPAEGAIKHESDADT